MGSRPHRSRSAEAMTGAGTGAVEAEAERRAHLGAERGSAVAELPSALAGLRPAWVSIDLDRLTANLRWLRQRCGDARLLAVVKGDAYGHGAVTGAQIGRASCREGVEGG